MFILIAWIIVIGIWGSSNPLVDKYGPAAVLLCVILHFVQLELVWRHDRAERRAIARR